MFLLCLSVGILRIRHKRSNEMKSRGKRNPAHSRMDLTQTGPLFCDENVYDITLEDPNNPTHFYSEGLRELLILGRSASSCNVVIGYDDSVSNVHCSIYRSGEEVYLKDLDSTNGTFVNGMKIFRETLLHDNDLICLGRAKLLVHIRR